MSKTTQLSTRVTEQDAEFLSALLVEGANTPSDKLRALIGEARRRQEELGDYAGSLRQVRQLIGPTAERILQVENEGLPHSEMVTPLVEWLSETLAFVLSQVPHGDESKEDNERAARALESGLTDRAFRLVSSVLRLGITSEAQCYDAQAISSRLKPILDLARVIDGARQVEVLDEPRPPSEKRPRAI